MSGWPLRIVRSALGPVYRNLYPPENPETDLDADHANLANWQLAGAAAVVPRVVLIAEYGTDWTIHRQAEAWNPEGLLARPTLARSAAGRYTYTFAANYPDRNGNAVPTVLFAPRVTVYNSTAADESADRMVKAESRIDLSGATPVVEIRVIDWIAGGFSEYIDRPFRLEVD